MRISCRESDPGYDPNAHMSKVFLNGKEVHSCFTADEELGEAWVYVLKGSNYQFTCGGIPVTDCLKGKVEIR